MVNLDYLYNPEAAKPFFKIPLSDKKLGFQVIEHGTILPHKSIPSKIGEACGIIDSNGNAVSEAFVAGVREVYIPPPESIQHSSKTVVYLGAFPPLWGHSITDGIRWLWFFHSDTFKREFKDCQLVYIPWFFRPLNTMKNFSRLLEIFGIDLDKIQPITQPTQFDKIILPNGSFAPIVENGYYETIDYIRNFVLKNRTPTSIKKIYSYYGTRQVGEERLAEYFKSKGYEIITHEQRLASFDEELNLLINCESFASTLGSIAHDSVFLRDGTQTIFIPRAFNFLSGHQQILDQVFQLNSTYIDTTFSICNVIRNSFCFIISEQLKRFFGDKWNGYEEEDFKTFLNYYKLAINSGLSANPRELKGYGAVFQDFMAQLKRRKDLIAASDMPYGWELLRPLITYKTHFLEKGWGTITSENQISNDLEQKLSINTVQINSPDHKVYYSEYNEVDGWLKEVLCPNLTIPVSSGARKPIKGMRIWFDEVGAREFNILYRMHKFDGTWTPWAKNGEALYSHGPKVNAIQVKLEPVNIQSDETQTEELDYQTFLSKSDDIYLQGQRPRIKVKPKRM